jgi:hypothetical protein
MRRELALWVLILVTGGYLEAQTPALARTALRLGVGLNSADYTCTEGQINANTGVTVFAAATRTLGPRLTAGMEATVSDASSGLLGATLLGAFATAGARGGPRLPVWGTLGLGWVLYTGDAPDSNGPALSVRAGVDLPIGARIAFSPYAGYLTMLGDDGPHHVREFGDLPEGVPTRVSSLQIGIAAALTL